MTTLLAVAFQARWHLLAGMLALALGGCAVKVVLPQDRSIVTQSPTLVVVSLPLFFDGRFGAQLNDRDITSEFVSGGTLVKSASLQIPGGEYRLNVGACGNFPWFFLPLPACSAAQVEFSVSQRLDLQLTPSNVTLMPGDPAAMVTLQATSVNANGSTTLRTNITPVASAQHIQAAFTPSGAFDLALNSTVGHRLAITVPTDTRSGDRTLTVQAHSASGASGSTEMQVKVECQCGASGDFVDAVVKPVVSRGGMSGTSPDGRFIVTLSAGPNGLPSTLSVASLARPGNVLVGPFDKPQAWGFSPDSRYLVIATSGPSSNAIDVQLFDLTAPTAAVVQEHVVGCETGDLGCSPPSSFCYSGSGPPNNGCLNVGGNTTSSFQTGIATWGFGPDSRSFLFVTVNPKIVPAQYQLRLYSLPAGGLRVNAEHKPISSFWKFSPCGDLFMHFHQESGTPSSNDMADFWLTAPGPSMGALQTATLELGAGGTVVGPVGAAVEVAPSAANTDFNVQLLNLARSGAPRDSFASPQCRRRP